MAPECVVVVWSKQCLVGNMFEVTSAVLVHYSCIQHSSTVHVCIDLNLEVETVLHTSEKFELLQQQYA